MHSKKEKNTNILILVEKKSQSEILLKNEIIQKYIKGKKYQIYHTYMVSAFTFNYPSNITYKEYPKSNTLSYKLNNNITNDDGMRYIDKENTNKEYFSQFSELILCPDPDHTGVFSAYLTLEKTLGKNWKKHFKKITYIKFMTFDTNILNKQFNNLFFNKDNGKENIKNEEFYDKSYQEGLIKRYFEYNYNINSNIFLKEILNKLDIKTNLTITKYMLLAFYQFSRNINKDISKSKFLELLVKHKGSGKYTNEIIGSWHGIGSPASISSITNNLIKLGLIEVKKVKTHSEEIDVFNEDMEKIGTEFVDKYKIILCKTKKGEDFFKLSSKKIFDIDLKYRLNKWMILPFDEAKEKIDKYLIDMFKTQKRKNKYLNNI